MATHRTCLLVCEGLSWTVGGARIVDGVNLAVGHGEFVALIGPNGAGKTSLFNLLSGVRRPTGGRIRFAGNDITNELPYRRARRGIGRTFQSATLFDTMTVTEHIIVAARVGHTRADRRPAALRRASTRLLERVGLAHRGSAIAGSLSHGDKRKLEIALLLAAESTVAEPVRPRVLLLDEPMAGVSAEEVPPLVEVIRAAHRETEASVLMVEHHMDVVMALAQRIAVMHNGTLLTVGEPEDVVADPAVQQAYLGHEHG